MICSDLKFLELVKTAKHYTSDSRKVGDASIFVALAGEKTDGHEFVEEVLKKNPLAVFVEENKNRWKDCASVFEVPDTHEIHRKLAAHFRKKFKGILIAVAGSNGKTSTKEFIHTLLSQKFKTIKTQSSQNGHLGIPLTIEQLSNDVEMAVVEVGIDNKGDMLLHSQLVQPDICVMTSIGEEHLRQLGSIEGVFDEEKILAENCLANGGNCFFPEADEWLKKIKSTNQNAQIFYTPSKVELLVPNVDLKDFSAIMQQNAALAISVAMHLGMTKEEIKENVKLLKIPMGRGSAYECRAQCWILEDHYNANPSSLVKSLTNAILFSQNKNLPLTVILGDMLDLGSDSEKKHKQIWDEVIQNQKIKKAVLIGPEWGKFKNSKSNFETEFFISSDQASKKVISTLPKQGVFLFKGSRGMALEKVLDKFKELK